MDKTDENNSFLSGGTFQWHVIFFIIYDDCIMEALRGILGEIY